MEEKTLILNQSGRTSRFFSRRLIFGSFCLFALILANTAHSRNNLQEGKETNLFPVPRIVNQQTSFWLKIFSKYHGKQIVIHDPDIPNIIIDVIDFNVFSKKYNRGRNYYYRERQEISERYLKRYQLAIERVQKRGKSAARYGAMEKRILQVYMKHPQGKRHLFNKKISLRSQTGLADEFATAAIRSKKYMSYIENIFRKHNVPTELSRIAFVESMFNEKAVSKVGASGIWQLMPATARRFMLVNRMFDERNSPLKASTAAAKLLAHNYKSLKSWPLAITAYNHGAGGMRRAVRKTGTRHIGKIIQNYRGRAFGFASKNFYAEFLAAKAIYRERYQTRIVKKPNPLNIAKINISKPVSIHQLIAYTPLDENTLKNYNQCLKPRVFERYRYTPLPHDYQLIVPERMSRNVKNALKKITIGRRSGKRGFRS